MKRDERDESRVSSLQVLRAIAALSVVFFHVSVGLPADTILNAIKRICALGFIGVGVFFVLSGYVVMSTAQRTQSSDVSTFLLRRLGRIYGGYWPVLVLAALLSSVGVSAIHPEGRWLSSVLLVEPTMGGNVLSVAYTLVYELWFYLLTATVVAFVR